ncbi:hypothetical protein RM553_08310 [Zunongwangia sp. F363]|uniref:Uncharacterized protein n=1 Tax=Autumnicola tepida TaxID=3075595 RepID=A0ABU3C908_9FLAO|nr:hypothetical protein [Zunongwangia sp. F363]MDT0642831.1 hypothetical protein [Zunongwangia sp. F363]
MKIQLDIKSTIIGFLSAALLIATFSFKSSNAWVGGKFQTEVSEKGVIILDTETGAYIMTSDMRGYDWNKGNFTNTHQISKDNTKGK